MMLKTFLIGVLSSLFTMYAVLTGLALWAVGGMQDVSRVDEYCFYRVATMTTDGRRILCLPFPMHTTAEGHWALGRRGAE